MQAATSSQGYGQWQWTSFFLCCATASANGICQRRPTAQGLLSPWPTASQSLSQERHCARWISWSISISLLPSAKATQLLPPSDTWCVLRQCCGHPASSVPAKSHRFRRSTQISSSMPCSGFKVIAFLHWVVPPQWSLWRLQIAPQPVWDPRSNLERAPWHTTSLLANKYPNRFWGRFSRCNCCFSFCRLGTTTWSRWDSVCL